MSNNEESNDGELGLTELNGETYGSARKNGQQADRHTVTAKAVAQCVGRARGQDMKNLVLLSKEATFKEPEYPKKESREQEAIWSKKMDWHLKKSDKCDEQKAKVFTVIMAQCEEAMKNRVESELTYESMEETSDVVGLSRVIKDIAFNSSNRNCPPLQAVMSWKGLARIYQEDNESLVEYCNRFMAMKEMEEGSCGAIAPVAAAEKDSNCDKGEKKATEIAKEQMLATMFMGGANKKRFGAVLKKLVDDYALDDKTKCPETVEAALEVLALKEAANWNKFKKRGADEKAPPVSFAQEGGKLKCWHCKKTGHKRNECPECETADGQGSEQQAHAQIDSIVGWAT